MTRGGAANFCLQNSWQDWYIRVLYLEKVWQNRGESPDVQYRKFMLQHLPAPPDRSWVYLQCSGVYTEGKAIGCSKALCYDPLMLGWVGVSMRQHKFPVLYTKLLADYRPSTVDSVCFPTHLRSWSCLGIYLNTIPIEILAFADGRLSLEADIVIRNLRFHISKHFHGISLRGEMLIFVLLMARYTSIHRFNGH